MAKYKFPENFTWGAATSGPQTEGWTDKKNFSIYDYWFQIEPEKFHNGVGPEINCDTYRKYKEDVELMKEIGLTSFRTAGRHAPLGFPHAMTKEDAQWGIGESY